MPVEMTCPNTRFSNYLFRNIGTNTLWRVIFYIQTLLVVQSEELGVTMAIYITNVNLK